MLLYIFIAFIQFAFLSQQFECFSSDATDFVHAGTGLTDPPVCLRQLWLYLMKYFALAL